MKTLIVSVLSAAFTFSALAGEVSISPRAAANFPATRNVADAAVTTITYAGSATLLSPRAQANQTKVIQNAVVDSASTLACVKTMSGSPKTIQACNEHPATMPGCNAMSMVTAPK
jgi:hypothetical protein